MSTETEFTRWLERSEKTFTENLQFALKAWQSAELTLPRKYEIILEWLVKNSGKIGSNKETFQATELSELLQLKCQPGLIEQSVKKQFVQIHLQLASRWRSPDSRLLPEILQQLTDYEILQDLYRFDYELYAELFCQLLTAYEKYLETTTAENFLQAHESEFFMKIVNTLKASAKNAVNPTSFEEQYSAHIIRPLVQVLLVFQSKDLRFFDELVELEKILSQDWKDYDLVMRIVKFPMHVCLMTLECAIINNRGIQMFYKILLMNIFHNVLDVQKIEDPSLMLTIAAHTLEMFRKHDVNLSFEINDMSALSFLGEQIFPYVEEFKGEHLQQSLLLLCATLHLNPLILEKNIFQLTVWMMMAEKKTVHEQELFEEFLILLMDMFRKLSRAEKFVVNLLKALNEWLQKNSVVAAVVKGKRKIKDVETENSKATPQKKKRKLSGSTSTDDSIARYLQIILKEFHVDSSPASVSSSSTTGSNDASKSFPHLQSTWPWSNVGVAFSKLIVGLMSKPSMVICKSLLYSLKDIVKSMQKSEEITENSYFQLDFVISLICQFFAGCKLAEQSDKFWSEIEEQRRLTGDVLADLGHFLLQRPHNKRTMNAFLECCFYASHFDLIVWFYRSDRLAEDDDAPFVAHSKNLHGYLSEEEWSLIGQRVINFGKSHCKFNLNRLFLQRMKARVLFSHKVKSLNLHKILLTPIANDLQQLNAIFQSVDVHWLLRNLKREEKLEIVRLINSSDIFDFSLLPGGAVEDLEFFELLCVGLYEKLAMSFASTSKKSILGSISFDELTVEVDAASDQRVTLVADAINAKVEEYSLKKLPLDEVEQVLGILKQLPIGYCRRQTKGILFALHLALYRDLKAIEAQDLVTLAFDIFTDLLHFGQQIQIFKYFPTQNILRLLPVATSWEFYEFLFASMKNEEKGAEHFLTALVEILQTAQKESHLDDDLVKLTLISIETLSSLTGPGAKRLRRYLDDVMAVYACHVNEFFAKIDGRSEKKDKRFVEKTLPGFAAYVKSMVNKNSKKNEEKVSEIDEKVRELDENFRRICKIYIGYSMDYHNMHAIKLITVALNNRQQLHFDQDEIEFVLNGYWRQLNEDLRAEKLNVKNAEAVIKLIIGNKTNEDLLLVLKEIATDVEVKDFANITLLLSLIAKSAFSTIKGAIFNEHFKQITFGIVLRLEKDEHFQFVNFDHVLSLLRCQQSVVDNKMIPMSSDTLDDILAFLMDINIKKFPLTDTNVELFNSVHRMMSELCTSLMKQRHDLLMDRVPQFIHIFEDLLQAIVWYKSDRQKDTALSATEIDDLVELALKMEALMHIIATHRLEVKRVAPFVLTFVINLMVANKRPTTLYPKIKTHIENICYDLVGMCDHRVGRFILRCLNEAARQVYELLVKDHKKYHKFKGKV